MRFFRSTPPEAPVASTPPAPSPPAMPPVPLSRYLAAVVDQDQGSVSGEEAVVMASQARGDLLALEKAIVGRIGRDPLISALRAGTKAEWIDLDQVDVQPEVAGAVLPEVARSMRVACVGLDERALIRHHISFNGTMGPVELE